MTFPSSRSIPAPAFAGPRRLKTGLKDFKSSAELLIWASRARKLLPWAYDSISVGDLHVNSGVHTSTTSQNCNLEIGLVNSTLKFAKVS